MREDYYSQSGGFLTIEKAKELNFNEIYINCHKSNEASSRMIEAVGAELESEVIEMGSTEVVQRYVL